MRRIVVGVIACLFFLVACKKDENMVNATILDTGDVTFQGCGYLLRLDNGRDEKPVYLDSRYQHDGLKVKVRYRRSNIYDTCGVIPFRTFFELVYIEEIKRAD